jgi:hypothetical protein
MSAVFLAKGGFPAAAVRRIQDISQFGRNTLSLGVNMGPK